MNRDYYLTTLKSLFRNHACVALLGPRQCGKTTLAQAYRNLQPNFPKENYFDLEDPVSLERLQNPKIALQTLKGLIIIDEIQRRPELFTLLRVLIDQKIKGQKFLLLGSASQELIQQSSESLAGRIAYLEITPFLYYENKELSLSKLWLRGGFPRSYLARSLDASKEWRDFYIQTFLEQDIPNLGIRIPANTLRKFWMMIAHYHGNIMNFSELGRAFGISDTSVKRYLDILVNTFMVRELQPWQENLKKRQVKAPKVYVRDSGILHSLLRIDTKSSLETNPKIGASWEGFAIEQIIQALHAKPHDCYFWSTHNIAELDLLLFVRNKRLGFEFKYNDAPKLTNSMRTAMTDLKLDKLTVIYPGNIKYELAENISVCGLEEFINSLPN